MDQQAQESYLQSGYDIFFRKIIPSTTNTISAVEYDSQQEGFNVTEYSIEDGSVTNKKIKNIRAEKIVTSTLEAAVDIGVGTGFIRIDGPNNRIIVNDGTNDRILIGFQEDGF